MGSTTVNVVKINENDVKDYLPPGIYTVKYNKLTGFYLGITKDKLTLPPKIYGKVYDRAAKCLHTYKTRIASTGILMTGDKGTGKSLFMSVLANEVVDKLKLPVILVQDAYAGSEFTSFIENIGECCIVFDEFGKMYGSGNNRGEDEVKQKELLTLMDGVDKTKRMFVMTENNTFDINDFLLNRPGRIYYHFKYKKLDEDSINDYCIDKGVVDPYLTDIIDVSRRSRIFSFDMLQTIVEEHIRFGTEIQETIEDLNIDLKSNEEDMMEITKVIDKETNEEIELFGDDKMYPVPNRTTYIRIKSDSNNKLVQAAIDSDVPEEVADFIRNETYDYEEVYISDSDLAYQNGTEVVYDNKEYVIYAKELPSKKYKYYSAAF